MKDISQRMQEYVNYHLHGDGECTNIVIKEWMDRRNLSPQARYEIAFLFSVTYCPSSTLILFEKQQEEGGLDKSQLKELKGKLLFQSDRRYMKMGSRFEDCLEDFYTNHRDLEEFLQVVCKDGVMDVETANNYVMTWPMFGRYASYLFLETLLPMIGLKVLNTTIDWKDGDTATSGLLNLFGYDEYAERFDRTGKLAFKYEYMDKMLDMTFKAIEKAGGEVNVTEIESSLCAYRKFYKGTRYNGYYLDRMLEEIEAMRPLSPEIADELLDIRRQKFDKKWLGEISGWRGIRKDLKKLYKESGLLII